MCEDEGKPCSSKSTGASGLPAGLFGPHLSTDDAWLSQITRAGVRATWQQLCDETALAGHWSGSGVLEHRGHGERRQPQECRRRAARQAAEVEPQVRLAVVVSAG